MMVIISFMALMACSRDVKVQDTSKKIGDADNDSAAVEHDTEASAYSITTNIIGSGLIEPLEYQAVPHGEIRQFTVLPAEGFEISAIDGTCGGSMSDDTYATAPIVSDCVVEVRFTETVIEPVPYCENIPVELIGTVVCDPDINLDDWSIGAGYSTNSLMIPRDKILSMPFTSNAIGLRGHVGITNNMPGLYASGLYWRGWFSDVPGGEQLESSDQCAIYSPNPNPYSISWNQTVSDTYDCHLGTDIRTLYFNMEVRCYEFLSSNCTPGEFYDGDYYLGLANTITD